jgi:hypothetical protein
VQVLLAQQQLQLQAQQQQHGALLQQRSTSYVQEHHEAAAAMGTGALPQGEHGFSFRVLLGWDMLGWFTC